MRTFFFLPTRPSKKHTVAFAILGILVTFIVWRTVSYPRLDSVTTKKSIHVSGELLNDFTTTKYFPGKENQLPDTHQISTDNNSSRVKSGVFEAFQLEYRVNLAQVPHLPHNLSGTTQTGPPVPANTLHNSKIVRPLKKVLWWTLFFLETNWLPTRYCETTKYTCVSTGKKEELLSSDAVIFHARDMYGLPKQRLPNQRWIYFNMESTMNTEINFRDYNGVFNWTVTYMRDADFSSVYYRKELRDKSLSSAEYSELFSSILHKKSGLVAARISNCDTHTSDRIRFVRELQHYIPVDFYGACGDLQCPKGKPECEDMSRYKFFLSFENSNCRDYITEKVRLPLHVWDAVPIVMGGSHPDDYLNTLPPNSYIHVKGFSSVKRLAQYLIFLDQNSQFYETYHSWKKTYTERKSDHWCDVCRALHNDSMPVKFYTDLERWHYMNGCTSGCETGHVSFILLVVTMASVFLDVGESLQETRSMTS